MRKPAGPQLNAASGDIKPENLQLAAGACESGLAANARLPQERIRYGIMSQ